MCLILIELVEFALEQSAEGRDEIDVIFFSCCLIYLFIYYYCDALTLLVVNV